MRIGTATRRGRCSRQFRLDARQKTSASFERPDEPNSPSIGADLPGPELLVLDEPTSGLDPIVRREFIQTVIGAYQDGAPGQRTVFVSTHLISEFEGLIDEFTIIERGREVLTLDADAARARFQKIHAASRSSTDRPRPRRRGQCSSGVDARWKCSSTAMPARSWGDFAR